MASVTSVAHRFDDKERSDDVKVKEDLDFSALLLSPRVQDGLTKSGFVKPSPIQLQAIPLGKFGLDLIVQAKSGTGKTCIFAVIALENIILECTSVQTLVLAPTREIASQICGVILSIGSCIPSLSCHYFIGGLPLAEDIVKLRKCQIAVGTPGRIKQLIECKCLNTNSIRLFVLDEADKLLDKDFQQSINWIYQKLPHNKQMLALSATYPESLAKLLTNYMRNPAFVRLNTQKPALLGIIQFYTITKFHPLSHVAFQHKFNMLSEILSNIPFSQCLVFINLQSRAQLLCDKLNKQGWASTYICGNQDQVKRLRTMAQLKSFQCRILVTTDLTARGIDCQNVDVIINVDLPEDLETYLHRIGRAGRFGSKGLAITIVSEGKEKGRLFSMNSLASLDIRELPKPLSSNVWNSNLKDSNTTETNSEFTKTNDSLICILSDDLFRNENEYSERDKDVINDNTFIALASAENNARSDKADGISSIKKNESCEIASVSPDINVTDQIQNHDQSTPVTILDLQESDNSKHQHIQEENNRVANSSEEQESCTESSKCLNDLVDNLKLMDINDQSTGQLNFEKESNFINESTIDDLSQFYEIKSHPKIISYADILEELDAFQVVSQCQSFEQYQECLPSEKSLKEVSCFLNQTNIQYWNYIGAAANSNNLTDTLVQSNLCENDFVATVEDEVKLLPYNSMEKALVADSVTDPIQESTLLQVPKQSNCNEENSELFHEITCNKSLPLTEKTADSSAVDTTVLFTLSNHEDKTSVPKLKEYKTWEEEIDSLCDVTLNSLQLASGNSNLDSPTINVSLTVDTSNSISPPVTEPKKQNKISKNFPLSNSQTSFDHSVNVCNEASVKPKATASSESSNELDYSSEYSDSDVSNEENSQDILENFEGYIQQDNYVEETLPIPKSHSQQRKYTCSENSRIVSMPYRKDFLWDECKRCEHLSFTPDCWQQSDYGYCSAQAENNYGQSLYCQNYYRENCTYWHCMQYENQFNQNFVLPTKACGKLSRFNNFCCRHCYWKQCSYASQQWCYNYTRYISEMLEWRKSQKRCSCE